MAFVYEHDSRLNDSSVSVDHEPYLVSVDEIEELTGLNFFANLAENVQTEIESDSASSLWSWDIDGERVDGELLQDLMQMQQKRLALGESLTRSERFMSFDSLLASEERTTQPLSMRSIRGDELKNLFGQRNEVERLQKRARILEKRLDQIEDKGGQRANESRNEDSPLIDRIRKSLSSTKMFSDEDLSQSGEAENSLEIPK